MDIYTIILDTENSASTSKEINFLSKSLLLTPRMLEELGEEQISWFEENGYVIGTQSDRQIQNWLADKKNQIIVNYMNEKAKNIVGFTYILGDQKTIDMVKGYSKDIEFTNSRYAELVNRGNFYYLL